MILKLKTKDIKSAGLVSMKHLDEKGNILGERNFNNLLTDAYFEQETLAPGTHMQIGTGTTPPEVTDTTLENFHQGKSGIGGSWTSRTSFSGPVETATKINRNTRNATFSFSSSVLITEVGLSSSATGGTLYARSLIKDQDGIPNPFQMEAGHQLTVSYAIDVELPRQLSEVATIASPWPAPYDGDISVVIAATGNANLINYTVLHNSLYQTFVTPTVNVNRALGSITYTLNKNTAFGTSDTFLTNSETYKTAIEGLDYYSNGIQTGLYHVHFRQEGTGSDRRVVVPANHNFSIEFETGIDWGRKP